MLAGPGGLLHGDLEIAELALDLLPRQHVQAARQDRRLDHRRLGPVEALERRVVRLEHDLAMQVRTLLVLLDARDLQLGMGERGIEHAARHAGRPLASRDFP